MISPETIERIRDAMRIEEVVGDFVSLRKRGVNLVGLCPFHNEKTPSFHVHPVKGIFKCFGCGEGGNPIDFLIRHEQFTYIEALRWLAKKYNIEVQEEVMTEEQSAAHELRERLFNLNAFATAWFQEQFNSVEGKAITLSYCRNRGITDESIVKFQLGYSPERIDAFSVYGLSKGYSKEILLKSGMSIDRNGQLIDRFRGRLIFPIHNISGRIVGFGGRILHQDSNRPKYVNSIESDIYQKSKTLYGIFHSRSSIAAKENCYLVEGYTDVIALHQVGVTNVAASSGTSLTEDQIRLIRRYSPDVTIIYDGDAAGIKASFRGIDMILQEGLNVRIIPMPEGEDPDSFARNHRSSEVNEYFTTRSENFITFKAGLLKAEAAGDPVKMGTLIREIIRSVALIPDPLLRPLFVKQCADITGMEEEQLIFELNRQLRNQRIRKREVPPEELPEPVRKASPQQHAVNLKPLTGYQEDDIIRLLLNYGDHQVHHVHEDGTPYKTSLALEVVRELIADDTTFENPLWQKIYESYKLSLDSGNPLPDQRYFIHHEEQQVREAAVNILSSPYQLSHNWKERRIHVPEERDLLARAIDEVIDSFRLRKIEAMMQTLQSQMALSHSEDEEIILIKKYQRLLEIRKNLAAQLGRTVSF